MTMTIDYQYPVFGTQGGGIVRFKNGQCVFVEKPDCPGFDVGDVMPEQWGLIPANKLALCQMDDMRD